jgi:hypothetical protein
VNFSKDDRRWAQLIPVCDACGEFLKVGGGPESSVCRRLRYPSGAVAGEEIFHPECAPAGLGAPGTVSIVDAPRNPP